jgi:hypothetical protein
VRFAVFAAASLAAGLLGGCAQEVARVPFTAEGSGTTKVTVGNGGIDLWTDLDLEYSGTMVARYDIKMSQGGKVVMSASCDPFDVRQKVGVKQTTRGVDKVVYFTGKMGCRKGLEAVPAGVTDVSVALTIPGKPTKLTIHKLDLVLKE